jgi:hypothetical protein
MNGVSFTPTIGYRISDTLIGGIQTFLKPGCKSTFTYATSTNPVSNTEITENYKNNLAILPALFFEQKDGHNISFGLKSKYEESYKINSYHMDVNLFLVEKKSDNGTYKLNFGFTGEKKSEDEKKLEQKYEEWIDKYKNFTIEDKEEKVFNYQNIDNLLIKKMMLSSKILKELSSYILDLNFKIVYTTKDGGKYTFKISLPSFFYIIKSGKTEMMCDVSSWNPVYRGILSNLLNISLNYSKTFNEEVKKNISESKKLSNALLSL